MIVLHERQIEPRLFEAPAIVDLREKSTMIAMFRRRDHLHPRDFRIFYPHAPPFPSNRDAETLAALAGEADETVCVAAPQGLGAIGFYYEDFHQMSDDEVTLLLAARSTS